jgi:hypothetical protein
LSPSAALTRPDAASNALFGNPQTVTRDATWPESDPDGRRQFDGRRDGEDDRRAVDRCGEHGTRQAGQEATIFKVVFVRSLALACLSA